MTVRRGSSRKGQLNKRSQRGDQGHLPDFDVESFHEMDRDEGAMGHLPDMDNDSEQGHLPDIGDEESIGRAPYSVGQTGSGGPGLPSKGSLYACKLCLHGCPVLSLIFLLVQIILLLE